MVKSRPLLSCMVLSLAWLITGGASDDRDGFLSPGEFDVATVLEPAPRRADPRYGADRKIFRATRALQGTPRWQLATNDTKTSAAAMMQNFSCAAGIELTPQAAPKLAELVRRASLDTVGQTSLAKGVFARARPFLIDRGPVCQPVQELLDRKHNRMSYDYPSGHTTLGWTWALVLTAVMPERGQQILARGRAYGESRFVCGAHNKSAVEAGFQSASATMAIISSKSTYQSALAGAREEVAALKIKGAAPTRAECDEEKKLITLNLFH
ncbi:MAG: phosphatase PAP2 family protein [Sphingomonas sp.]|uniref:acid phosphatase n=1 Tax=Sphingomonas sp. TaxID=28214 RepID=UPI00262F650C|nr:phosphatase PAP2 family protein [Sphingomonas sp.]MDK2769890.1 phosphatase PAP2 family protein [Sphingomonas sp.]